MKKLLSLAAAFLLCAGVQAQIVSSRSVSIKSAQKQPSETQWFLRGGLNVMKMTGDGAEDTGSKLGYNFVYGFQKPLGSVGTYWEWSSDSVPAAGRSKKTKATTNTA